MPPRRRTPIPTPIDVDAVRRKLAEGKIVRVGISRSAQFPDGGIGRVRRIGDPTVDGEEYIQVELTLNGTKDTLPFTPADLTPATRATNPAAAPAVTPRSRAGTPKAEPARRARAPQPGRKAPDVADHETNSLFGESALAAPTPRAPARPAPSTTETVVTSSIAPTLGASSPSNGATLPKTPPAPALPTAPTAPKPKSTRGGAKRTPAVAITIGTTDTEPPQWRIEAKVGARVVLRSGSVGPARVWELVRILDDQTLIRAVGTVLDDQRKAAQARADALATELAEVRAELEALPDAKS
jgi:hypothetical protein